ncbi:MAG: AAA family ATPase [Gammaproteobacteria bacterium]|nr:AAA family ATPase [Gammaproteobacteria bacterium]
MLKAFEQIRDFGVFDNYSRPNDIEDFAELNLIYGWNYSGKTTLSRILRSLEMQSIHPDYQAARFQVSTHQGTTITETSLASTKEKIRVFNSDFVKDNLSWNGDAFEPILLLGQQSIEAQKELEKNEVLLEKLREGHRTKSNAIKNRNEELSDKKTVSAKSIKQALQIVEAFTATHLNQELAKIAGDPSKVLVKKEELLKLQQTATADEKDKLPKLQKITLNIASKNPAKGLPELLARVPAMTNTIRHLAEHPEVANWIRVGLPLHDEKKNCEFCGNPIQSSRIDALRAHFSKDVELLESALKNKKIEIQNSTPKIIELHKNEFYPQWRFDLDDAQSSLKNALHLYNEALDTLIAQVDRKLLAPFEVVECSKFDERLFEAVSESINKINKIIESNNKATESFGKEKKTAIATLKLHFAADFYIEEKIANHEALINILEQHRSWYEKAGKAIARKNAELEAKISQAQKGREELNVFINKFLVGSNVSVDVISVDGTERFRLIRDGSPAKNLSEGERTAIAYAFFLIKLKEVINLGELVVYIDDPVSSLDSNHIFQIFAATKEFFFRQDSADGDKWKLTVEQLFVSTHNFEFLGLSKELPIRKSRRKYYFVKRLSIQKSTFVTMPPSIVKYSSEYQYLWNVIHDFYESADKSNLELLLSLPNALRRFVELYTYSKCPSDESVDRRADIVFGAEKSRRIMKLLHHFSHSNNLLGIAQNNDLICDVENVVNELIDLIKADQQHYNALMSALIKN